MEWMGEQRIWAGKAELAWDGFDILDSNKDLILNNDEKIQMDNLALLVIKYYFFNIMFLHFFPV